MFVIQGLQNFGGAKPYSAYCSV